MNILIGVLWRVIQNERGPTWIFLAPRRGNMPLFLVNEIFFTFKEHSISPVEVKAIFLASINRQILSFDCRSTLILLPASAVKNALKTATTSMRWRVDCNPTLSHFWKWRMFVTFAFGAYQYDVYCQFTSTRMCRQRTVISFGNFVLCKQRIHSTLLFK